MFQLPLPKKRITWAFALILIIISFLFYYIWDKGYQSFQKSYEEKYYEIKEFTINGGDVAEEELILTGCIIYPKYNLTSSPLPIYILIRNNYDDISIQNFYMRAIPSSIDGGMQNNYISSFIFNDSLSDSKSMNEILIKEVKPKTEIIEKFWLSNQFLGKTNIEFSHNYEVRKDGDVYFPEINDDDLVGRYFVQLNNLMALKSIVLPYLLIPPFSNAMIPFVILFLGFILETYLIDKQKTSIIYKNNNQNKKTLDLNIYNDVSDELGVFLIFFGQIYFWIKIINNWLNKFSFYIWLKKCLKKHKEVVNIITFLIIYFLSVILVYNSLYSYFIDFKRIIFSILIFLFIVFMYYVDSQFLDFEYEEAFLNNGE